MNAAERKAPPTRFANVAAVSSVLDRSTASRSNCSKINPPKLCVTNEIWPSRRPGSANNVAKTLAARSGRGIACPPQRVREDSCLTSQGRCP